MNEGAAPAAEEEGGNDHADQAPAPIPLQATFSQLAKDKIAASAQIKAAAAAKASGNNALHQELHAGVAARLAQM